MSDLMRGERLQIMLTPDELKVLDDWRFSRRMPSRASAVRELLRRGLAADGFLTAGHGSKSQDFGVTKAGGDTRDASHGGGGGSSGPAPSPKPDDR